jgi:hypothetical protein
LLKTFWTGWRDQQLPDGTIAWTSPTGQKYTTRPGSRLLFPTLCLPTGELSSAPTQSASTAALRGLMMPTRRSTRAQDRARRIDAERALNAAHLADAAQATRVACVTESSEPPPF